MIAKGIQIIAKASLALQGLLWNPSSFAHSVSLSWDPSPGTPAGYKIYCLIPRSSQEIATDVGQVLSAVVDNLISAETYTFYATSYDTSGTESGPSNAVTYTVPSNNPPSFPVVPGQLGGEGRLLTFRLDAKDADVGQTLTFSLQSGPAGATVNANGTFAWIPTGQYAQSTNAITVMVTDNGQPPLSTTRSFAVVVRPGYWLRVAGVVGGTVEMNPLGNLNPQGTKYIADAIVAVTARPAPGFVFDHWALGAATSTANPIVFRMVSDRLLTPYFVPTSHLQF